MRITKKFIIITVICLLIAYLFIPFWNLGNSVDFDEKNSETWFNENPGIFKKVTVFHLLRVKDGMPLEDAIKILGKPQEEWGYGEMYLVWDTKYIVKYSVKVTTGYFTNEEGQTESHLIVNTQ